VHALQDSEFVAVVLRINSFDLGVEQIVSTTEKKAKYL